MHSELVLLEMTCDESGRHTATARWQGGVARHFGTSPRHAFEVLASALGGCLSDTNITWLGHAIPPVEIAEVIEEAVEIVESEPVDIAGEAVEVLVEGDVLPVEPEPIDEDFVEVGPGVDEDEHNEP